MLDAFSTWGALLSAALPLSGFLLLGFRVASNRQRVTGWVRLEGTLKFNPLGYGQGHLSLDQIVQSPIQPGLERFQGEGIHNFCGHSILKHSSKEFLILHVPLC